MAEQFTKGPWRLMENNGVFGDDGIDDCRMVASCTGYSRGKDSRFVLAQNLGNAHLIAAAPDLFDALEGLLEAHGSAYRSAIEMDAAITDAEDAARAALSKARGEPND